MNTGQIVFIAIGSLNGKVLEQALHVEVARNKLWPESSTPLHRRVSQ